MIRRWLTVNRLRTHAKLSCTKTPGFKAMSPKSKLLISRKKAARSRTDSARQAAQSCPVPCPRAGRARHCGHQTLALCERHPAQYLSRLFGCLHGNGNWFAQPACSSSLAPSAKMNQNLISNNLLTVGPDDGGQKKGALRVVHPPFSLLP